MNEKEKNSKSITFIENDELNLNEFYANLNHAISTNNLQSIYELSKAFTRYYTKILGI
ncbi:MAG: hypothetical protein ACFE9I_07260 [Candidatus Hermodarchaeota archaeon]